MDAELLAKQHLILIGCSAGECLTNTKNIFITNVKEQLRCEKFRIGAFSLNKIQTMDKECLQCNPEIF